jgi:hypothetical protein
MADFDPHTLIRWALAVATVFAAYVLVWLLFVVRTGFDEMDTVNACAIPAS